MTPLEKCIEALAVLARADDPNRLVLMERAVDSFAKDSGADDEARYGALDDLAHTVAGQGWDREFTTLIMEYIAKQRDRRAMKD
jgi:hypothetical protein